MVNRVVVAMSGGVDSSLAAALLREEGYEVIGVLMRLCGSERTDDARRTCQILDIPLHIMELQHYFQTDVIDYFCEEYRQGRTPNPCVVCNERIKFGLVLKEALRLGADYLATGHYARIDPARGSYRLLKGIDPAKDQSYFLYTLGQDELKHLTFPLGRYRKDEVRRMAAERGLPIPDRGESQEVCFIPDGNYRSFLAQRTPTAPGEIVDLSGRVVGRHQGVALYTIGQRHGLGIASRERLYVTRIDGQTNTVVIGREEELWSDTLLASKLKFVSGKAPHGDIQITAKIRYRSPEAKAVLSPRGDSAEVRFDEPQRAIAPGQAVVFYRGEEVLGGGTIESAR